MKKNKTIINSMLWSSAAQFLVKLNSWKRAFYVWEVIVLKSRENIQSWIFITKAALDSDLVPPKLKREKKKENENRKKCLRWITEESQRTQEDEWKRLTHPSLVSNHLLSHLKLILVWVMFYSKIQHLSKSICTICDFVCMYKGAVWEEDMFLIRSRNREQNWNSEVNKTVGFHYFFVLHYTNQQTLDNIKKETEMNKYALQRNSTYSKRPFTLQVSFRIQMRGARNW